MFIYMYNQCCLSFFSFFLFFTETVKIEAVQNDMRRVLHNIVQHWVDLLYRTFLFVVVTQPFFWLVDEVGGGCQLTIEWSSWHSWPLWHVTGCVGGTVIEHDHLFTIPFHCGTKTWNVRGLFIVLIRHVSSRFKWCLRFRQVTAIQLHLLLLSSTNKEVWMNRFFVLSMGPV